MQTPGAPALVPVDHQQVMEPLPGALQWTQRGAHSLRGSELTSGEGRPTAVRGEVRPPLVTWRHASRLGGGSVCPGAPAGRCCAPSTKGSAWPAGARLPWSQELLALQVC